MMPLFVNAASNEPIFGVFGFQNHTTFEAYQQYVGKTVQYLPCEPLSYSEKLFETEKLTPEAEYVITEITPKTGQCSKSDKITITFQEKNGKKKHKMKAYASWAYEYPFIFIDDFNANKSELTGARFSDPLIKGAYTVSDVRLEKPEGAKRGSRIKEIVYYVNNPETNISFKTTNPEMAIEAQMNLDKEGTYETKLAYVEKTVKTKNESAKPVKEEIENKYIYKDDNILAIMSPRISQIEFRLTNLTQTSIKLIWDDAVFVDYKGTTSKIMHNGIKYSQREASQPASTIIRGSSLDEIACPISNVRYSDALKEWVVDSMYPNTIISGVKQIRLMLPIQIDDKTIEYVFVFDIEYQFKNPERLNL